MIYLASPYTHEDKLVMKTRFLLAEQCLAHLIMQNVHVYSPIVHFHEVAAKYRIETEFSYWKKINFDMIRRSDMMYVLDIDGWSRSKGVQAEMELAQTLYIPIQMVDSNGLTK